MVMDYEITYCLLAAQLLEYTDCQKVKDHEGYQEHHHTRVDYNIFNIIDLGCDLGDWSKSHHEVST
jgi:hypothetical protein